MKRIKGNTGFTLVEILAVIAIIGVLGGTATVGVAKNITKSHDNYCASQVDLLRIAGRDYFNDNTTLLPMSIGKSECVTLDTLINNKYIEAMKDYNNNACNTTTSKVCAIKNTKTSFYYTTSLDCGGCSYNNSKTTKTSTPNITFSPNTATNTTNKDIVVTMKLTDPEYPIISYSYKIYQVTSSGDIEVESIDFREYKEKDIKIKLNKKGTFYIKGFAYNSVGGYKEQNSGRFTLKYTIGGEGSCNGQIKITAKKTDGGVTSALDTKTWTKGKVDITIKRRGDIESYDIYVSKTNAPYGSSQNYVKKVASATANSRTLSYAATETGKYSIYVVGYNDQGDTCSTTKGEYDFYQDNTSPGCQTLGSPGRWVNYPVTLTPKCSDDDSGCDDSKSSSNHITMEFDGYASPGRVYDNVGNYTQCPSVSVQIDMTAPICILEAEGTEGNNNYFLSDIRLTAKSYDFGTVSSGIVRTFMDKGYKTNRLYMGSEDNTVISGENKNTQGLTEEENKNGFKGYHNAHCIAVDRAGNVNPSTIKSDVQPAIDNIFMPMKQYNPDNHGWDDTAMLEYRIDKNDPTYEIEIKGTKIGDGYADGGLIMAKCSDIGSGIVSGNQTLPLTGSVVDLNGYCEDDAGRTSKPYQKYLMKCESPTCGAKTCRNAVCGVESYNYCRTSACGSYCSSYYSAEDGGGCRRWDYYRCQDPSCGVARYRECTTSACGNKECWVEAGSVCTKGGGPTSPGSPGSTPPVTTDPDPEKTIEEEKEKKDTTPPKCGNKTGGKQKWTNDKKIEIGVKCSDSGSGCKQDVFKTEYKKEGKTAKVTITIEDKAGNKTKCTNEYDIYLDRTAPTISFGDKVNINSSNVGEHCDNQVGNQIMVPGYITEKLSGIDKAKSTYLIGPTQSQAVSFLTALTDGYVSTASGNQYQHDNFCSRTSQVYVKYNLCDNAGNCTKGETIKSFK